MVNEIEIYKELNVGFYKINETTNFNDTILYDINTKQYTIPLNLVKILDILLYNYPSIMIKIFTLGENENLKDFYKTKEEILNYYVNNQKKCFNNFKNFVVKFKVNIDGYSFEPRGNHLIEVDNKRYINMYDKKLFTPKNKSNKSFPCLEFLLRNILQEGYDHFLHMLAWKIQRPTDTITINWIIHDRGGTGKTEILHNFVLDKLFATSIIGQGELDSPFNSFMKNTEFIICEEIEGYENEKKIKMLTGAKYITINEKMLRTTQIRNYNNFVIFSNDIRPLKISYDDRRFNVVGGGKRILPLNNNNWKDTLFESQSEHKKFFDRFHKEYDKELEGLYNFLINHELDKTTLQITLNTKAKERLIDINNTSEHEFLNELIELGIDNVVKSYVREDYLITLNKLIITKEEEGVKSNWVRYSELYKLYNKFVFSSNLKPISKKHLLKRLQELPSFNSLFGEEKVLSYDNEKFLAVKIRDTASNKIPIDENKTIKSEINNTLTNHTK